MIKKILNTLDDKRLSSVTGLDASFLYGETPTSPMHVGSVAVIEGSLDFKTYRDVILSRIHQIPSLRQKLMFVPLSVDYPYWVDDPDFNIDLHLHRVALPNPGSWSELRAMASHIFSEPLDRSRPLWSFTFVEGLNNIPQVPSGSVAVVSKIHHVSIDGMAGAGMLSLIFDLSPKAKEIKSPKIFRPKPLPNEFNLVVKSAASFAKNPLRLPKIIGNTLASTIKTGMLSRSQHLDLPTVPFTAPNTPLNGIISAKRKWNSAILDLERVKTLKRIMGTTLNDVILAICAGALRKYLNDKEQLPKKPLVAMVPISTRAASDTDASGNQLSMMLVQLATDIADPIARLEKIHENTTVGKTYQGALGARSLSDLAETVPFGVANLASRIYSRYHMAKMHNPVFNLVITNVPGPPVPLYLHGHKLLTVMGMAPIIDGMGLLITVFSYDGHITISPTSDANSMPDIDLFSRYIRESANYLESHVLEHEKSKPKNQPKKKPKSDALFTHFKKYLKENPGFLKPNAGTYQFNVNGATKSHWQLHLNSPPGTVRRGVAKDPDATITISDRHLYQIGTGKLDFQTAFIQGRISLNGEMKQAMKLAKIISLIPNLEE